MQQTQHELRIDARDLNLKDLDFPECSASLKQYIDKNVSDATTSISLDLRWCVVIYSQANIYLDSCLTHLASGTAHARKLTLLTTHNYPTRDLTCYELFRTTKAVGENDRDRKSVAGALHQYCLKHGIIIEIQVFSGDDEDLLAPKLHSYTFGEAPT